MQEMWSVRTHAKDFLFFLILVIFYSRAKKNAMEEAEVHGRMALEHLMQF